MKKNVEEFLFHEAIKYLGKYPATKKKIEQYLQKKLRDKSIYKKAIFSENMEKNILVESIVTKLDKWSLLNVVSMNL